MTTTTLKLSGTVIGITGTGVHLRDESGRGWILKTKQDGVNLIATGMCNMVERGQAITVDGYELDKPENKPKSPRWFWVENWRK